MSAQPVAAQEKVVVSLPAVGEIAAEVIVGGVFATTRLGDTRVVPFPKPSLGVISQRIVLPRLKLLPVKVFVAPAERLFTNHSYMYPGVSPSASLQPLGRQVKVVASVPDPGLMAAELMEGS